MNDQKVFYQRTAIFARKDGVDIHIIINKSNMKGNVIIQYMSTCSLRNTAKRWQRDQQKQKNNT